MTQKTKASREELARVAALVRPALASKDYIPALTCIRFDGGEATAYNDVTAIGALCTLDIERCVPGDFLIRAMGTFGGADVVFERGADASMVLKSGRSTLKTPTLDAAEFPFAWPGEDEGEGMPLDRAIVRAIERCLVSVGSNPAHPAQMGVTLESDGGRAVLYSTDNYTVSRCDSGAKVKLPGDAPVILPRFFCEQLVALCKAHPEAKLTLVLLDGAVLVEVGERARILTKTPVDLVPLDFPRIVSKHVDLKRIKDLVSAIPDAFDGALNRALLVLSGEVVPETKFEVGGKAVSMESRSAQGTSEDEVPFDNAAGSVKFSSNPQLLQRGAKACALVGFTERVTVMADADCTFVHLVAHLS